MIGKFLFDTIMNYVSKHGDKPMSISFEGGFQKTVSGLRFRSFQIAGKTAKIIALNHLCELCVKEIPVDDWNGMTRYTLNKMFSAVKWNVAR